MRLRNPVPSALSIGQHASKPTRACTFHDICRARHYDKVCMAFILELLETFGEQWKANPETTAGALLSDALDAELRKHER